ncbi:YndM family protein [Rossellomorea vietnamensis]|uniref:YndM family protein n=1 Tax=Rossellomorea vietnamensis TaxID=218284 RepID=UPI003CF0EEDA
MRHLKAFLVKFTACFALLAIILGGIYGVTLGEVFLISLVLGAVSYAAGDLFLLPRSNNTTASLADFGLAFVVIWAMMANVTPVENVLVPSLIAAAGVAGFEFFYHKYLYRTVLLGGREATREQVQGNLQFQAEVSEELTPARPDVRNDEGDK